MQQETSLYLIPTPIGNLGDMTFRGVEVLRSVDLILAEDTRTSGFLLKHYEINTKMQSFHAHNEHKRTDSIISMLEEGQKIALISDAGTPGISDPGFLLARAAIEKNIKVECLPGATAFVPALIKSGLPNDRFIFEGFLPHKKGRQTRIREIAEESRTIVLYESPHRIQKLMQQLSEYLDPERIISISRELTKKFEETITLPLGQMCKYYSENQAKGEFVVVIEGKPKK